MRTKTDLSLTGAFYGPLAGVLILAGLIGVIGCQSTDHTQNLTSAKEREMTVGIVQKEIRVGMPQSEVAAALGSPNIVTRDEYGKETWVYDKIAREASYSKSAGGGYSTLIITGIGGGHSSGATSVTEKSLTVVIKFDGQGKVESFTYRATRF